jgi:Fe2+ or Zn2+ uptake regulation protein
MLIKVEMDHLAFYELKNPNPTHIHLYCKECQTVVDLDDDDLQKAMSELGRLIEDKTSQKLQDLKIIAEGCSCKSFI